MLTLSGITKAYGERVLFADATLQVNRQDRIGLVGPNGAGKTTLFTIILGHESADAGQFSCERGVSIGYLPQENAPVADETVIELATAITPEYTRLRRILKAWEADHPVEALHSEDVHDDVHDRFNELGGYRLEAKAKQILAGLSFREKDFERPAREMSGGWVMRAHLARLLTQEPDLLLLDEPTNHLDLEALLWFQEYLKSYPGAILVISHDREFLNQLVGSIIEIRQSRLIRYRGGYDEYLEQREAYEQQQLAAYKHQEREIARLMEFVNRFRAKNTKATQAQSKLKQIERMDKIAAPEGEERKLEFQFPQPRRSGLRAIRLEGIHHAYGENVVYRGMDFEAERGQRTVLVGPNGAGKSTLLKILAGVVTPQAGTRTPGHNVKVGYYSQYRVEMLHPERTVLEEAFDTPQRLTEQFVRTLLGCFLFSGDDVFKRVEVLSGGEKSRLALVKLLLDPPNLLLMDEPTTHLDLSSVDALAYALDQFEGTLLFISHDVYFIRALANHVVHVNAGRLTHYPGGYQYYLDKTRAESARAGLTATGGRASVPASPNSQGSRGRSPSPPMDRKEQKRVEAEQRQARSRQRKAQQQVVHRLEKEIQALEARQAEIIAELEKPETYEQPGRAQEINRELMDIQRRLAELNPAWEQEATRLAVLDRRRASKVTVTLAKLGSVP
ncbi:MAG TPA: ABC-F family ATP-binding cassette domain-containing protein, partial [Verrucomicrobiota bacterium]|nr:ABC-F family ATP-binding cassette domain-containing protein [Verrucomicrobiota bacterium]HQL80245.1 ABC-F family ATP-binding cassette domain-containing protein [Verrucomicrobiota bacterium]